MTKYSTNNFSDILFSVNISIIFINEWFNHCLNEKLLLPESHTEPDLRWHTHDQAIINVLYRKYIKNNIIGFSLLFSLLLLYDPFRRNIIYCNCI